ncbi:MAG: two-component system sensor histidine kinase NtrB [Myxococcaceae bacterium]
MTTHVWISLVASAGQLALAFAALRVVQKPLGLPLTLLSLALFGWNTASIGYELSGLPAWHWFEVIISPTSTPLGFHFILTFVGRRRQLRALNILAYLAFGLLSLSSVVAFLWPPARGFADSGMFARVHLLLILPVLSLSAYLLWLHLERAATELERARTSLLLIAIGVIGGFASTEVLADLGFPVMRIGSMGILIGTALMAVVTFRLNLLQDGQFGTFGYLSVFSLSAVGVLAYVGIFRWLGFSTALLITSTAVVTLGLVAAARKIAAVFRGRRERVDRFVTLGRLSAQMAHDLKNPLAALKGAAQFLQEESAQGRGVSTPEHREFVDLILDQADRLGRVVDQYQRLGSVEPLRMPLPPNELVRSVLALQHFASTSQVSVKAELGDGLPQLLADRDLLAGALENLLRNAFEAMPDGGTVTVRTAVAQADDLGPAVQIQVQDSGIGMDARTRERAFHDFWTSKPHGTGMGLAFVRRVVEAHGGDVALESEEGKGTLFTLRIPVGG